MTGVSRPFHPGLSAVLAWWPARSTGTPPQVPAAVAAKLEILSLETPRSAGFEVAVLVGAHEHELPTRFLPGADQLRHTRAVVPAGGVLQPVAEDHHQLVLSGLIVPGSGVDALVRVFDEITDGVEERCGTSSWAVDIGSELAGPLRSAPHRG